MPVRPARAAHAAGAWRAGAGWCLATVGRGGREHGQLLGKFRRTTMRTRCPLPIAGTNQNLAVLLALPAMKFVNRHGRNIAGTGKSSSLEADSIIYAAGTADALAGGMGATRYGDLIPRKCSSNQSANSGRSFSMPPQPCALPSRTMSFAFTPSSSQRFTNCCA